MGNVYYAQERYPNAIKMYRMALDQLSKSQSRERGRILRNISNALIRQGHYQDAIDPIEEAMSGNPTLELGMNLIVCYFAVGEADRMVSCVYISHVNDTFSVFCA